MLCDSSWISSAGWASRDSSSSSMRTPAI
uniref:Uncharacterized protein n=1 Tax=Arundo donax TaxID=35708 RepID=A0A0A8YJJ6_ARUDO